MVALDLVDDKYRSRNEFLGVPQYHRTSVDCNIIYENQILNVKAPCKFSSPKARWHRNNTESSDD